MYTVTQVLVSLSQIFRVWNVRISEDGTTLKPSIITNGIQTPLWGNADHNGSEVPLIRGHRRLDALKALSDEGTDGLTEEQTEVWNQLFGDGEGCGIPMTLIHGASPSELAQLHIDQDSMPLRTITECAFVARALFERGGMKHYDVAEHMAGILDMVSPPRGKKAVEIEKARSDGNAASFRKLYGEYRHGTVQYLKRLADLPDQVLWSLQKQETGSVPAECNIETFPKVTRGSTVSLEKALKSDVEIRLDDGSAPFSRQIPGPAFKAEWEKQVQSATDASDSTEKRAKAMSAKDIAEQAGKWKSQGFKGLCDQHSGGESTVILEDADTLLWLAEFVSKENPDLWVPVEKLGRELAAAFNKKAMDAVEKQTLAKAQADGEAASKPAKKKAKAPEKAPVAVAS